jgi:molybdopterin/thiamine biosynthesis adenylyltransferase
MVDDLYSRQEKIELSIPTAITIVGCGGIGSWVAIFAAMSGIPKIYLFDPDIMEESNRNRLPFCQASLNRPKVQIVAEYINAIRPDCNIIAIQERCQDLLLKMQLGVSDYVIDCTDSPKSQLLIYKACKEVYKPFIRGGYDGTHVTVTSNVSGWIKKDVVEENYIVNPSWVVPSAICGALVVGKLCKYKNQEVSLDISEIGIPVLSKGQSRLTPRCTENTRKANPYEVPNTNS